MAIKYGFFDSVDGDRKYSAEDIGRYLQGIISNGVYADTSDALQVLANGDMTVTVQSGRGMLDCHYIENDEPLTLTLESGGTLPRIDAVVMRLSTENRDCTIAVKQGTAASTPARPTMARNDFTKEWALAFISVGKLASTISQTDITDTRGDNDVCGWVRGLLDNSALASLAQLEQEIARAKAAENEKAPTSHASTATTYGAGTGSNYGHVKLSDSTSSTSAASAGIAATPKAVKAAYDAATAAQTAADGKADNGGAAWLKTLNFGDSINAIPMFGINSSGEFVMRWVDKAGTTRTWTMADIMAAVEAVSGKAPTSHASTATTYGAGTGSNYGHVKLSDSTSSTSAASAGIAATPKAVKAAYDAATAAQTAADGKAAASHTQAASTITTGTFPANVKAYETARTTRGLFNEEVRSGSTSGTLQSVKYFINVT